MNEVLFEELKKEFNFGKNEIQILKCLHTERPLSADEICENTKIPKGKIYTFLNKLVEKQLIQKKNTMPATYSVENFEERLYDYINFEFKNFLDKQSKIISLIDKEPKDEEVEIFEDKQVLDFNIIKNTNQSQTLRLICKHLTSPFILYPESDSEFLVIREEIGKRRQTIADTKTKLELLMNKSYNAALKRGLKAEYIMGKAALEFYINLLKEPYGKKKTIERFHEIRKKMEKYGIKINVVNEYLPLQVYIFDNRIISLFGGDRIVAVTHSSDKLIEFYNNLFNEMLRRSKPFEYYLKKYGL